MDLPSLSPLLVVAIAAAAGCITMARYTASLRDGAPWRLTAMAVFSLFFVLTVWPIVAAVVPTDAVAEARGIADQGVVALPADFRGPARVMVRGAPAGSSNAEARVGLRAGDASAETILARRFESVRVGKAGRMAVERDNFAKVVAMNLPKGATELQVQVSGATLEGNGLSVRVHRDLCPLLALMVIDVLALAALVLVAVRGGETRLIAAGGALLGFAIAATRFIEPGAVARPLVGALLIGGIGGAAVAGAIGSIVARLVARPAVRTPRTA